MSTTLILLDIGNTSVTYGVYSGGRLQSFGSSLVNSIPNLIYKCSRSGRDSDIHVVISSVVPNSTRFVISSLRRGRRARNDIKVFLAGRHIPVPVRHNYKSKNKLGIDRLVNLYGAKRIYKPPVLMIDFGTAVTLDYLSRDGVFKGGMIIPGPEISFQTLLKRAALIPASLRLPVKSKSFLGRDTYGCLTSGILEGYGSMMDELIRRFKSRFGKSLQVISTGGFASTIKPYSREISTIDPRHSIKSLLLLYKDHKKTSSWV